MKFLKSLQKLKKSSLNSNIFTDKKNNLVWHSVNQSNVQNFENHFAEIDTWSSNNNIRKFIFSKMPLGKVFKESIPSKESTPTRLYICTKDKDLIGLTLLSLPMGNNNFSTIEYIIVNPNFQNMGYGTKMIKSISKNLDYFSNKNGNKALISSVNISNYASQKMFIKNEFAEMGTSFSELGYKYIIYKLESKETKHNTNENEREM